jgi:hypothetical protein
VTDIQLQYDQIMAELDDLAEIYLEHRAAGKPTDQISTAIKQADRESRKLERKLRRANRDKTAAKA